MLALTKTGHHPEACTAVIIPEAEPAVPSLERLYAGPKSDVFRGPEAGTVIKVYKRGGEDAAKTEFERLSALYEAFGSAPGLRCPQPLRIDQVDGKTCLFMKEIEAVSLIDVSRTQDRPEAAAIATSLAEALRIFGDVIGEPYYGLKPQDVFVCRDSGDLLLLDFEPCHSGWQRDVGNGLPTDVTSAAVFAGRVLHVAAAPQMLTRTGARRWLIDTAVETAIRTSPTNLEAFDSVLQARYRRGYERYDCMLRAAWYRLRRLDLVRPAVRRVESEAPTRRLSLRERAQALLPGLAQWTDDIFFVADLTVI